ncbi:tetratricopeptide repeat protein [Neorhizobium alkalisoli]|uniref:tetratricopeptide repeat protein n=1 Tax=Neorhizobium alkalisoli TaxID=528178 RepID=UPI000CF982F8|nr:tetratricopeptide repeat protein [Neorhizobium alkalisoli]
MSNVAIQSEAPDIARAKALWQSSKYDDALELLSTLALEQRHDALLLLLEYLRKYPDRAKDIEYQERLIWSLRRFSTNPRFPCEVGWFRQERDQFQKAEARFRRLLRRFPLDEGANQGLIAALRKQRDFSAAEEHWKSLQDTGLAPCLGILCEGAWIWSDQRDFEKARPRFEAVLRHSRAEEDHHLSFIFALRHLGALDDIDAAISRAIGKYGKTPRLGIEIGWLHASRSEFDAAERAFEAVLLSAPHNEAALQGKVATLRQSDRLADAAAVLAQNPTLFAVSMGLQAEKAWIHFAQKELRQAEKIFRALVARAPQDDLNKVNLAWALEKQGGAKKLVEAAAMCREALILHKSPEAFGCLGVVCFNQGNHRDAEIYLKRSIELDILRRFEPDLVALYTFLGQYQRAQSVLSDALIYSPFSAALLIQQGDLRASEVQWEQAAQSYQAALQIEPRHPVATYGLVSALQACSRYDEAETSARLALKTAKGSERSRLLRALVRVLIQKFEETKKELYLTQADAELRTVLTTPIIEAEAYFLEGIIAAKQKRLTEAKDAFTRCHTLDPKWTIAETYALRIAESIPGGWGSLRKPDNKSWILFTIILAQLVFVWAVRLAEYAVGTTVFEGATFSALVTVLTALLFGAVLLPLLNKFSVTGMSVELDSMAKMAETNGPTGSDAFDLPVNLHRLPAN